MVYVTLFGLTIFTHTLTTYLPEMDEKQYLSITME